MKYFNETQAREAEEEDEHENPNYHLGCMFLVFRIAHGSFGDAGHRDFALTPKSSCATEDIVTCAFFLRPSHFVGAGAFQSLCRSLVLLPGL